MSKDHRNRPRHDGSVVAVMEAGSPEVLINAQGQPHDPSVVGFTDKGDRLIGQPAKHQQVTNRRTPCTR